VSEKTVGAPVPARQREREDRAQAPAQHARRESSTHPRRMPSKRSETAVVAAARRTARTNRKEISAKPTASTMIITIAPSSGQRRGPSPRKQNESGRFCPQRHYFVGTYLRNLS
jgi:hypothetical protein